MTKGNVMDAQQQPFRRDNTQGYSDEELQHLNEEFRSRGGDAMTHEWERQALAEQILKSPPDGIEPGA